MQLPDNKKIAYLSLLIALSLIFSYIETLIPLNFGIAGATSRDIHRKDIVIAEKVININSYRTKMRKEKEGSNPLEWELLTFLSGESDRLIEQSANPKLLSLTKKMSEMRNSTIYYGKIGSGDAWNQEIDRMLDLNKKYGILCEDMEAIATYTICNRRKIPVISIKMISDNAITGEEYKREVGISLKDYIINYIKIIN